jgi:hypothetical protein
MVLLLLLHILVILHVSISDQLLLHLLLLLARLSLHHFLHTHLVLFILTGPLSFLFLDPLLFFFLSAALSVLFLLATGFLILKFALFLLSLLLSSCLSFHLLLLCLSCSICTIVAGSGSSIILGCPTTENLLDMWCGVNASGGRTEHRLQEKIGLLGLVSCYNFSWLHVQLFSHDKLSKLNQLHQEVDFVILFGDRLGV